MDNKEVQTSFIPKKPLAEARVPRASSSGLFILLSVAIFVIALLVSGGAYLYRGYLDKKDSATRAALNAQGPGFEESLIDTLTELDMRLSVSKQILSRHIAISPIFSALEGLTLKSIRFTKFTYTLSADTGNVDVKMSGQAKNYTSIALQLDKFAENKNIKNPIFSNFSLDDKGNVNFDLVFSVDPSLISYGNSLSSI